MFKATVWQEPIWIKVKTWWQILPQHQSNFPTTSVYVIYEWSLSLIVLLLMMIYHIFFSQDLYVTIRVFMTASIAVALGCLVKLISNLIKKRMVANRRRRPVFHLRSLVSTVNIVRTVRIYIYFDFFLYFRFCVCLR